MAEKFLLLIPELILFAGAVLVSVLGLSPRRAIREALPAITGGFLVACLVSIPLVHTEARMAGLEGGLLMPGLSSWVKTIMCLVGLMLVMVGAGSIDRRLEREVAAGRLPFDPLRTSRGEYYAFLLLSVIGVMLCAGANDLIWLFVALELSSLPTYIMIAMSRPSRQAQESAMKYLFLGALSTAVFLYGFALLYGATGTIILTEMREAFGEAKLDGGIGMLGIAGMMLAIIGVGFKLAAVPMHFYAADVYEGASAPVTAFIGFAPKVAGAVTLMLLLGTMGWQDGGLPQPILFLLWTTAVLTMTLGNIGALLQGSLKRLFAYSSIAHSGYLMIGLIAGPGLGFTAVLFYLFAYGIMNTGVFGVIAGLERRGEEVTSVEDLSGLRQRHPAMAWALAICAGSLLGFPPLLGFVGKIYIFLAGIEAGQIPLVVIAALNSAISAWYYLRLIGLPILGAPTARSETIEATPMQWPRLAAIAAAVLVLVLPFFSRQIIGEVRERLGSGTSVTGAEVSIDDPTTGTPLRGPGGPDAAEGAGGVEAADAARADHPDATGRAGERRDTKGEEVSFAAPPGPTLAAAAPTMRP